MHWTAHLLIGPLLSFLSASRARAHLYHPTVQTPHHLLAQRSPLGRVGLLGGEITVGSLLNISISGGPGSATPEGNETCFPLRPAAFPPSGAPSVSRKEWWCDDSELYGFLGFSYPLEVADCSDPSNSYEQIYQDLTRMKSDYGATFVRPYGVECRKVSVWEALAKACVELQMGLIVQVWWGFQADQNLWKKTQASIYQLFTNSTYADVAPYIVYSASFGSEPIGDGVDGNNFIPDLQAFRKKMNSFGVPVGISEDWDRTSMRSGANAAGIGAQVLNNTDVAQLHVMPYYHPDEAPLVGDAWSYVEQQVQWARTALAQPTMITETMWSSSNSSGHLRGAHDEQDTLEAFATYWDAFASNCSFFKEQQVGWFVHTYSDDQEPGFGMLYTNGTAKLPGWKPSSC